MPRLSQFQSPTSPSNLSSNALFTYVSSFCCPVFGGQCFLFSPLIFFFLCTYVSKPRCVQIQIFFVCLFHQLGGHKDHFVMTTITPHAPNLYWIYVLGYEHDFCHDIDQPPPSPTLPSTLYWNYVLGYEIRHTDHFCHDIPLTTPTLPPTLYWNYVLCYK